MTGNNQSEKGLAAIYPKSSQAWFMVIVLTVVYVLSFVDRYILGLLVEPIKSDLGLTDTQMGLLLGPAFAVFYAIMGLPLGWLADKKRRTWIVGIGVAVWSLSTVLSGFARNFMQLFLLRMGVGVGEATLSPCTMSLIADSFPKEKRARPIALYSMAISVGAGLAALVGGTIIGWTMSGKTTALPFIGEVQPWEFTLIIVGAPGLLLAPIFFFMKEPKRQREVSEEVSSKANLVDTARYLLKRWPMFLSFMSVFCLMTLIGYSTSWGAAVFSRTWGWSPATYGQMAGIMFLVVGPITVNASGWMSDYLYKRKVYDAPLLIPIIGLPIMVVAGFVWPLMPTPELAMVVLGLTMAGVAMASATGITALLNVIPANIRGQTVAIYYMLLAFFGLGFGPSTIGLLSDHVFGEGKLHHAMAALPIIYGIPVLIAIPVIRRLYLKEFHKFNPDVASTAQNSNEADNA